MRFDIHDFYESRTSHFLYALAIGARSCSRSPDSPMVEHLFAYSRSPRNPMGSRPSTSFG
eukprot:3700742-Prymnesium_polylepis.1